MLLFLPAPVRGLIVLVLMTVITFGFTFLAFFFMFVRFLPIKTLQNKIDHSLHNFPEYWIYLVKSILNLSMKTRWHVSGIKNLKKDGHYIMIANHRSWVDILVLQKIFSRKVPILRFFMKKQLLWQMPLIGYACKLLGYPVMERSLPAMESEAKAGSPR